MTHRTWRDGLARRLGLRPGEKLEIYRGVAASATLTDFSYWAELLFSAGIATLGLTLGSPAVIIGAMLISPLMGPILAAGLALAAGDFVLAVRSMFSVGLSSIAAVAFSTALVVLLPFREMTAEIAARTQPNTLDLGVALLSGAVGALAICKSVRGVATSLPGVAIAVALMPPLCVAGYGVGLVLTVDRVQGVAVMRGGALLFVTNLVAITFASMLVFLALHLDAAEVRARLTANGTAPGDVPAALGRIGSLPARLLIVAVIVASVFVPLKRSFDALVTEIRARQQLNVVQKEALAAWEELFGRTAAGRARSYVDRFEAAERDGKLLLQVRVFTAAEVTKEERGRYVQRLARELDRPADSIDLSLVEIPTSQYRVASGKTEASPEPPPSLGERLSAVAAEASRVMALVPLPPGAMWLPVDVTLTNGEAKVSVVYLAPRAMSADASSLVARSVRERLELPRADVQFEWLPSELVVRADAGSDVLAAQLQPIAEALRRDPSLGVRVVSGAEEQPQAATVAAALEGLTAGASAIQLQVADSMPAGDVRLTVGSVDRAAGAAPVESTSPRAE